MGFLPWAVRITEKCGHCKLLVILVLDSVIHGQIVDGGLFFHLIHGMRHSCRFSVWNLSADKQIRFSTAQNGDRDGRLRTSRGNKQISLEMMQTGGCGALGNAYSMRYHLPLGFLLLYPLLLPFGAQIYAIALSIRTVQPFLDGILACVKRLLLQPHSAGYFIGGSLLFEPCDDVLAQGIIMLNPHSLELAVPSLLIGLVLGY